MIPQHRLAILLDHVKRGQINNCLYHNTAEPPSLYSDHMCDRNDFPLEVSIDLTQHSDEAWFCKFSHDGTKLVTAGKDQTALIYDTSTFTVLRKLTDHGDGVAFASWSPDDSKLITCCQDKIARVWNVDVRQTPLAPGSVMNCVLANSNIEMPEWPLSSIHRPFFRACDRCWLGTEWRIILHSLLGFFMSTLSLEHRRTVFTQVGRLIPCPRLCTQSRWTSTSRS